MNSRLSPRPPGAMAALLAPLLGAASMAVAQPQFDSASPTAGSSTSQQANSMADKAIYKEISYTNKAKRGPAVIVIPGEIKSNHAGFLERFGPNNIADFGELELSQANFQVLERTDLGHLTREIALAYNLGDQDAARKTMQMGKLKSTKYVVKFDILKAEQIAEANKGFDGRAIGGLVGILGRTAGTAAAGSAIGSIQTREVTGMWLIGMRYKIMDASTTEQLAQGYKELKMEVGATQGGALGISSGASGGVGIDTMVQRLVQTAVWDIDAKYK